MFLVARSRCVTPFLARWYIPREIWPHIDTRSCVVSTCEKEARREGGMEGKREGGKEGERERGREGGKEEGREGEREGGRDGGREER